MKLLKEQQSGKSGDSAEAAVSSELLQGEIVDLKSKLNALKNENVKLKEGLAKSKQANQQYKTLADSAEKQVCSVNAFDFLLVPFVNDFSICSQRVFFGFTFLLILLSLGRIVKNYIILLRYNV